ncbi:MAG TPA: PQQ-dependent sugar dehydrogenase [Chloroflexota bacterium]
MQSPRSRRLILVGLLAACLFIVPTMVSGAPNVHLQPVLKGLRQPLDVRQPADGSDRLFVAEKGGRIRVAHGSELVERPFLDLTGIVGARGSEQGLLGLAFHPAFAENGQFFVNYTDTNGDSVVARYQVSGDPDVADPGTGAVIVTQPQPFANHNGGNLVFGPDGWLWIGFGDGGSGGDPRGNGQNPGTWLGKLLRVNVDGDSQVEIWGLGLRNPWRYSFDRLTGDLWVGDVGQNVWEEIDLVGAGTPAGVNFGWNVGEGNHCFGSRSCDLSGFVPAIAEYDHGRGDCAVVGGYVYRGSAYPSMAGVYFYADECSGRLWSLQRDEVGNVSTSELMKTSVNVSSFGEDQAGELYVTGFNDGTVYRLTAD